MNAKAAELGLTDTHFENPHGLDQAGHVSSARDVTALLRYALGVPFVRDALQRESVTLPGGRTFASTDDLLEEWAPLVAGKTGHTHDAGWSETAAATRGGATVYGAVLGSGSRGVRNDALRQLLTYGLGRYRRVEVVDARPGLRRAKTGYGQPARPARRAALDRELDPGRSAAGGADRRSDHARVAGRRRPGGSAGSRSTTGNRLVASSNLVAAAAVADAGLLAKSRWYASATARNLWEMLT